MLAIIFSIRDPAPRVLYTLPYTTLFRSHAEGCFPIVHPSYYAIKFFNGLAHDVGHEPRSEEHTSELQSLRHLVCRLLLEKKNTCHKPSSTMPLTASITESLSLVDPTFVP